MSFNSAKYGSELDFIDSILEGTPDIKTQAASVTLDKDALDVSKVQVPAEIYEQFTGKKPKGAPSISDLEKKVKPKPIKEEVSESTPTLLTEETGRELLSSLMEIRTLLSEMCTTGSMGTSMAPTSTKRTKKDLLLDKIKNRKKKK